MNEKYVIDDVIRILKRLEGTVVFRSTRFVPSSKRVRPTEPYIIFERLVGMVLEGIADGNADVKREPGGAGQFPDWAIGNILIEVKSCTNKSRRFMVGAVKKLAEAFSSEDPKYLQANYIVFYYTLLQGNNLRIDEVSNGKIWNYSKPTAARSGRRPQWPSSRIGLKSVESWMDCYFENTSKRVFPVPRKSIEAVMKKVNSIG